jgi:hypothetical protein
MKILPESITGSSEKLILRGDQFEALKIYPLVCEGEPMFDPESKWRTNAFT